MIQIRNSNNGEFSLINPRYVKSAKKYGNGIWLEIDAGGGKFESLLVEDDQIGSKYHEFSAAKYQ